ncbi:18140_t:CDS:10, partial [Acaulospora morrowiae]
MSLEKEEKTSVVDEQPLTSRELKGWYIHNVACGTYDVAAISVFIPVILENLAAQAGYELDQKTPCNTTVNDYQCVVKFGAGYVDTSSYSLYVIAISVLFQAILFIGCASLADYGNSRKKFLLTFSYIGAILTMAFMLIFPSVSKNLYWLAGVLTVLSNCCYGAAYVFFLAYIPTYVRAHPDFLELKRENRENSEVQIRKLEDELATKFASTSMVWGFVAGEVVLFCGIGISVALNQTTYSLQLALGFSGFWWLVWLTFTAWWLVNRTGPPLPANENVILFPWKRVYKTLSSTRHLWQTIKFLVAWFLLSDGINTLVTVCVLFGKKRLHMTDVELLLFAIIVPICAAIGIYAYLFIQKGFNLTIRTLIIVLSFFFAILPLYAILGFWLPFGLVSKMEVWGHENEFFSLFQITAKGSSCIGPLITAIITNGTKDLRNSYWFLLVLLVIPIFIIYTVDVEKGRSDCKTFVLMEEEENAKNV